MTTPAFCPAATCHFQRSEKSSRQLTGISPVGRNDRKKRSKWQGKVLIGYTKNDEEVMHRTPAADPRKQFDRSLI
jgi:hypothetical protein